MGGQLFRQSKHASTICVLKVSTIPLEIIFGSASVVVDRYGVEKSRWVTTRPMVCCGPGTVQESGYCDP